LRIHILVSPLGEEYFKRIAIAAPPDLDWRESHTFGARSILRTDSFSIRFDSGWGHCARWL
jgi:hypothetical protein